MIILLKEWLFLEGWGQTLNAWASEYPQQLVGERPDEPSPSAEWGVANGPELEPKWPRGPKRDYCQLWFSNVLWNVRCEVNIRRALGAPHCRFPGFLWSEVKSFSSVWPFTSPWTVAHKAPPSMEFSRQEYWSGLPFPSPGDLPNPGIEPRSPALQADALTSEPPGKPWFSVWESKFSDLQ